MPKRVAAELKLTAPVPSTRHLAAVYLASLNLGSRPTVHHALDVLASLLTNSEYDALTWDLGIALRDITTLALSTLVNGTGRRSAQHGAAWETKALL